MPLKEKDRIKRLNNGELPDTPKIIISVKNIENPKTILKKVKEITTIASKYSYSDNWPSDEEWKKNLPKWFVESMTLKTSEDRDIDENLWHFESFIANLKDRFWLWYSSKLESDSFYVVLEAISAPYLHDTLVYMIYSQGVPMENIDVKDDFYSIDNE